MKILVGTFITESNANVPNLVELSHFDLAYGDECIRKMHIREVYEREGIHIIPAIYADAGAAGVITPKAFDYIESVFVDTVKQHLHELDGIYLMLHGASEVQEIGSGDHHILKRIRQIVGPYLPIAIACDPHGNLEKTYVESATIIRSYRESPHIDAVETKQKVSKMLCDILKKRQNIHAIYRKLPLILGGEQSVSTDEPVHSINAYMDELEKDSRIMSCSWHVGYIRHDSDVAGCGIVVVPATADDMEYGEQIANQLADYVWQKRHEFHYTGLSANPDEALKMALEYPDKPVFITDSGDNVTSGATGWNTFILRQVLANPAIEKRFLFANICDPETYRQLEKLPEGTKTMIHLGVDHDDMSKAVTLNVMVKSKGKLMGYRLHDPKAIFGLCVTVSVINLPIDIVVASTRQAMVEHHQFISAKLDWDLYDVIVVKQGYIFPELKEKGKLNIMSLTMGATPQDTSSISFKRIMRPMYPIDKI